MKILNYFLLLAVMDRNLIHQACINDLINLLEFYETLRKKYGHKPDESVCVAVDHLIKRAKRSAQILFDQACKGLISEENGRRYSDAVDLFKVVFHLEDLEDLETFTVPFSR
jgi:hypothetical protein